MNLHWQIDTREFVFLDTHSLMPIFFLFPISQTHKYLAVYLEFVKVGYWNLTVLPFLNQLSNSWMTKKSRYRMHPEISRFPSKRFYGGKLLDVTTNEMVTRSGMGNDALVVVVVMCLGCNDNGFDQGIWLYFCWNLLVKEIMFVTERFGEKQHCKFI